MLFSRSDHEGRLLVQPVAGSNSSRFSVVTFHVFDFGVGLGTEVDGSLLQCLLEIELHGLEGVQIKVAIAVVVMVDGVELMSMHGRHEVMTMNVRSMEVSEVVAVGELCSGVEVGVHRQHHLK